MAIAFAGITTLSVSLSMGGAPLSPRVLSIVYWLIMFFTAMSGLSHIFIREVEQGTDLLLKLASSADEIYLSKLIFNLALFTLLEIILTPLYLFFMQAPVHNVLLLVLVVFFGGTAIASATTILAAMVARADAKGSLFTVISFPVLLPVIWVSIATIETAFSSQAVSPYGNIIFLLAFSLVMILLSLLLFRSVWDDI